MNSIIIRTESFVKDHLGEDVTGHDFYHVDRVRRMALHISKKEKQGDPFIIEMAALLHDIPDEKLNRSAEEGIYKLKSFLSTISITEIQKQSILNVIEKISFKGGNEAELLTFEEMAVRDADRLDAIGAIGIARAFAYGGKKNQPIYDPNISIRNEMTKEEYRNGKSTSINHFFEKLLLLKDLMQTNTAKVIAKERHERLKDFLQQFFTEWNGDSENNIC